jgi:hypothetical protein
VAALLAASVVAIVVIPRLVLGPVTGIIERHRARALQFRLARRITSGCVVRGGPVRVRVIPYNYAVPPAALAGLETIVARAFGGSAALMMNRRWPTAARTRLPSVYRTIVIVLS